MNLDEPQLPPICLIDELHEWGNASEVFWTHLTEQASLLRGIRQPIKDLVVWLEIRGYDEAAATVDAQSHRLHEAQREFEYQCERAAPNSMEDVRCRDALDRLLDETNLLCAVLEDLTDDLPESAWEGYGDA